MKKTIIALCVVFTLMISVGMVVTSAKNQKQKFNLPKHAVEVSPGVFYLGKALDKGKVVEGYAFVHDKKENAKPPWAGQGKGDKTSKCYSFLAKGAKWKTVED